MIKPEGVKITNYVELKAAIMHLNAKAAEQELEIKRNVKELYYDMHPMAILKRTWSKFVGNEDVQKGAKGLGIAGLTIGAGILAKKLFFKKSGPAKSLIGSFMVERVAGLLLNSDVISNGVGKLSDMVKNLKSKFTKEKNHEPDQAF